MIQERNNLNMIDSRFIELAGNLVNYSCSLKPGEKILIENTGCPPELSEALIEKAYEAGGIPFVVMNDSRVQRKLLMNATEEQLSVMADIDAARMGKMDAYIAFRGGANAAESSDVPPEKQQMYGTVYWNRVHGEIRVRKTRWVVLRYPSPSMAQMAGMSSEAFEDFYFSVCNLDYAKMSAAMDPLKALMDTTDRVRITGKGTDLSFSIKGIGAVKCAGKSNIPDGEIYTAPVRDSVNGFITYNTPSRYQGYNHENVRLEFKDGKIIDASSNDNERLKKIFDTDEGARYIGEFALGVNPRITKAIGDILFDEKICGSFHFTPGSSYDEAYNGNNSAVHWDLVCIQTPEYGGGEMWFDDKLIRKDGLFVPEKLQPLNPENLI